MYKKKFHPFFLSTKAVAIQQNSNIDLNKRRAFPIYPIAILARCSITTFFPSAEKEEEMQQPNQSKIDRPNIISGQQLVFTSFFF